MARLDAVDAWMLALVATWGVAFVSIKALGTVLDPYQLTWYRYLPFLVIYGAWLPFARRERFRALTARDWVLVAAAGALGVIGYHFPLNWGMAGPTGVTVGTAAVLVATTPLWTLLVAVLIRQERFGLRKAMGSLVAFCGVAVVVTLGPADGDGVRFAWRALVVLLAPFFWALYAIVVRPLAARHGALFATGLTFCVGTSMLLPLGVRYGTEPLRGLDAGLWWWLVFLSLLSTVGGYTVWNQALKRRSATDVTAYVYLIPVVATLAGWLIRGEAVTPWFLAGAALVIVGLVQVHRARTRPAAPGGRAVAGGGADAAGSRTETADRGPDAAAAATAGSKG